MKYNFDEFPSRYGTNCFKWDNLAKSFGEDAKYPLFVADMDFVSAPEILDALHERVDHGVFGYTFVGDGYLDAIVNWEKNRHGFNIEKDWILFSPGVVPGVFWIVQNFTKVEDNILIFKPVYNPFFNAIEKQGRHIVSSDLVADENGHYTMDFADMEAKIVENNIHMTIFCSPHNPVGRAWTADELAKFIAICKKHDVLIVSDEIHQDIVFDGFKHLPTASVAGDYQNNVFTITAATKTFNLAGLQNSILIISDQEKRDIIKTFQSDSLEITGGNLFGYVAVEAAYTKGQAWLDEMLTYVKANYDFMVEFFAQKLPMLKTTPLEATYLAWVNFKELGLSDDELSEFLKHECHIAANMGNVYGENGEGFVRLNLGCPRYMLEHALNDLYAACQARGLCK